MEHRQNLQLVKTVQMLHTRFAQIEALPLAERRERCNWLDGVDASGRQPFSQSSHLILAPCGKAKRLIGWCQTLHPAIIQSIVPPDNWTASSVRFPAKICLLNLDYIDLNVAGKHDQILRSRTPGNKLGLNNDQHTDTCGPVELFLSSRVGDR